MNCFMCVGIRRPQRYEANKPSREGRAARPTSGDEEELVAESLHFDKVKSTRLSCALRITLVIEVSPSLYLLPHHTFL